jgi:hypothetical protein
MMKKPTTEETSAAIESLTRDVVGPRNPELMRHAILRMGGTREEADEAARSIELQNEKNGFGKARAS